MVAGCDNELRGGKGIGRWWNKKIGRTEDAECPRYGMGEEKTLDHIVFRCKNIWRVKDERGRREFFLVSFLHQYLTHGKEGVDK